MQQAQAEKFGSELERIVLGRIESDRLVVPAMPAVATKCLHTLRDADYSQKKLISQIEADPVLAALVLRHANSASHGAGVKQLEQAVSRLGAQRMKTLVMEYASRELFQSNDKRIAEANRKIWEHSIAVALLSRDLAAFSGNSEGDVCYLAGLLHDVGKPVLASMMLEAERKLGMGRSGWIDSDTWVQTVTTAHRRVGVAVASQWNLPAEVTVAIRDCSDFDANERGCAANVVRLSNAIGKREGYTTGPIDADDVEAMIMVGRSMLSIDDDVITRLAHGLKARVSQAISA
jgi:putative nucleotidyltransferase with HDIG domain